MENSAVKSREKIVEKSIEKSIENRIEGNIQRNFTFLDTPLVTISDSTFITIEVTIKVPFIYLFMCHFM